MQNTNENSVGSVSSKRRFLCNISSGWLAVTVNALVGVFVLPINLHYLGKEVYGISVLATSILLILHHLNFGMGPTLVRFFSKAVADGDDEIFRKTSSTAQFFTGGTGLIGAIIFMACFQWFCVRYDISGELKTSTFVLFCGMAFTLWEHFYTITYSTILQSYQRLDLLNYTRSILIIARVILLIFFYEFVSCSLISLGIVLCLEATLRLLVLFSFALRYGGSKTFFSPKNVDIKLMPKLFAFGALVFLNSLSMGLSVQIPSLIIGDQLGKAAVADFSAALTVTTFLGSILGAIVVPLTPLASIEAKNGGERLGSWAISLGQVVACVGYCTVLVLWLFGGDWITAWLGPDFAWTHFIVTIIATGTVLAAVQHTNFAIALGASTIVPVAWSSLVMAIAISLGTWVGLYYHLFESISLFRFETHPTVGAGLLGVAWLIFFVRITRNVFFLTSVYGKKFNYGLLTYFHKVYFIPFIGVLIVVFIWNLALGNFDYVFLQHYLQTRFQQGLGVNIGPRLSLICVVSLKSAIASILYGVICWYCVFPSDLKRSLRSAIRRK